MKQVQDALRALERAERQLKRRADWSDPAAKREYVREYKRKKRQSKLPADRKCSCGRVFLKTKSWVLKCNPPVCRSCYAKRER